MSIEQRMDALDSAINTAVEDLFQRAEQQPAPLDPNHSILVREERLRFLTRHLHDMQSLRWLPAHLLLIALPALVHAGHPDITAITTATLTATWFTCFQRLARNRFGESNLTLAEKTSAYNFALWKSRKHWLRIYILFWFLEMVLWDFGTVATMWGDSHAERSQFWPVLGAASLQVLMAVLAAATFALFFCMAMDQTNVLERRRVKAFSAAIIFLASALGFLHWPAALTPPAHGFLRWPSMVLPITTGLVLLANAIYDTALLLRCEHLARKEAHHA